MNERRREYSAAKKMERSRALFVLSCLVIAAFVATSANGINPVSVLYTTERIVFEGQSAWEVAVFVVDFDVEVAAPDGTPLHDLPSSSPFGMRSGLAELVCRVGQGEGPSDLFPGSYEGACNATHCVFPPYDSVQNSGPISAFAISLPAVSEPIFPLVSILSQNFDASATTTTASFVALVPRRYVIAKILRRFDFSTAEYLEYVPFYISLSSCRLRFFTESDAPNGSYLKIARTNRSIAREDAVTPSAVQALPICNYTRLVTEISDMFRAVDDLEDTRNEISMRATMDRLTAFVSRESWTSCLDLLQTMLDSSLPSVREEAIEYQCRNPSIAKHVLERYIHNAETSSAPSCTSEANDLANWTNLTRFVAECRLAVLGDGYAAAPSCLHDTDCYTTCFHDHCVVPYFNPEPYIVNCFEDRMPEELKHYLRQELRLADDAGEKELCSTLAKEVSAEMCRGPSSWKYNGYYELEQVSYCDGGPSRCFCWDEKETGENELLLETIHRILSLEKPILIRTHTSDPIATYEGLDIPEGMTLLLHEASIPRLSSGTGRHCWLVTPVEPDATGCDVSSHNGWGLSLDWNRIKAMVDAAVSRLLFKRVKSRFLCQHAVVSGGIRNIACDCGDVQGKDCFAYPGSTLVGTADLFAGVSATHEWGSVSIALGPSSVSDEDLIRPLAVSVMPDHSSFLAKRDEGMEVIGKASPVYNKWEVVTNGLGIIVGQLAGTGVTISVGSLSAPLRVCIERDFDIPWNNETFPVADFSVLGEEGNSSTWTPLGQIATTENLRICANVTEAGTYYPIFRVDGYETQTVELVADECGVIGGDNSSCLGCDGVANSGAVEDICGVCGGNNVTCCFGFPTCSGRGSCDSQTGVCTCEENFFGQGCEVENGCNDGNGTFDLQTERCRCYAGWMGNNCDEIDVCYHLDCNSPHGACDRETSACRCQNGYSGPGCETYDLCSEIDCSCRGTCIIVDTFTYCACQQGFYGASCEYEDLCIGISCGQFGQCNNRTGICECDDGWSGSSCQEQDLCYRVECGQDEGFGLCASETGLCNCLESRTGDDCGSPDLCYGVECHKAGGTCNPSTGNCICSPGWLGDSCNYVDCGLHGIFDYRIDACKCDSGYGGDRCDRCQGPSDGGMAYLCKPTLRDDVIPYYIAAVPLDQTPSKSPVHPNRAVPILPGSIGYDGHAYGCDCLRSSSSSVSSPATSVVSRASSTISSTNIVIVTVSVIVGVFFIGLAIVLFVRWRRKFRRARAVSSRLRRS